MSPHGETWTMLYPELTTDKAYADPRRTYPVQDMAPKEASPLDRLLRAISRLEEATGLVAHTTDSLCGSPAPEASAKGYPASDPAPAGHFAAISVSATRIGRMADAIIESMNRIQRVAG